MKKISIGLMFLFYGIVALPSSSVLTGSACLAAWSKGTFYRQLGFPSLEDFNKSCQ